MNNRKVPPPRMIGLAWFKKEDYPALRALFVDRDNMHDTWEEWSENAEKLASGIRAQGGTVERVELDPASFSAWCKANGKATDSKGRSQFAAEVIAAKYGNIH
jgi:hypothetical protein